MDDHDRGSEFARAVAVLRTVLERSQAQVARDGHISAGTLSNIEQEKRDPEPETVEAIAAGLHVPLSTVSRAVAFNRSVLADSESLTADRGAALLDPAWALAASSEARRVRTIVDLVAGELGAPPSQEKSSTLEEAQLEALALWQRMEGRSGEERLALVEELPEFGSWALSLLVGDKSAQAAADDADQALELAELALEITRRVHEQDGFQARVEGHAWAVIGNAWRVRGDLPRAAESFATYHRLWLSGSDPRGFLDQVRVLDLEASLRREQRRFAEAHALLDQALETHPAGSVKARLLLKQAKTFYEEHAYQQAIEVLQRAAPLVEAAGDLRLPLVLRTNLVENFLELGRFADAERALAEAMALAAPLGKELDVVRLRWLAGRLAAETGRPEEALPILAEVRGEFAARGIAYDTALATLEMAVLLADLGRTAEVKALAEETAKVFKAQRVAREGFAAVQLFVDAARSESLTADLARQLLVTLRDRA